MKQNAFNMLYEKYEQFLKDLSNVIQKVNFEIIPVHIDLKKLIEEKIEEEVYEYAFDKLISEFYKKLEFIQKGSIVIEARGKKEDRSLHKHAVNLIEETYEDKIQGIYFNSKWNKEKNITYLGLELADLCTYPIHKNIRSGKEDFAFKVLKHKIISYVENGKIKKSP